MEKASGPGSSQDSSERDERQVTVFVRNPHTPKKEVTAFLRGYCTVVRGPTKILNSLGFWTAKWSVTVRLRTDPSTSDGLQHLPPRCTLGNAEALITYPDMPQTEDMTEEPSPPEASSSQCSTEGEEKEVTVSVLNPFTPRKEVAAFLRGYCTVVRGPTKILNGLGFWTGKWSVTVRLRTDPSTSDGLQHLPPRCTLGNAEALITYPDMPQTEDVTEEPSPPEASSSQCSTEGEEKEVTVSVLNPFTPRKEVAAFLRGYCTVVRGPTKILNGLGFWTGKWSVTVRLRTDPSTSDGLQHLPPRCTLGNSEALITYPDMPPMDSEMDQEENTCTLPFGLSCLFIGHVSEDCPTTTTSDLQGEETPLPPLLHELHQHPINNKDCPKRTKKTKKPQKKK